MKVRPGTKNDIEEIGHLYAIAKAYMKETGNPTQWREDYPLAQDFAEDVENKTAYVVEEDGKIVGSFAFIIGEDPTYQIIIDGKWKDNSEYGTIHRLASRPDAKGVFDTCLEFCLGKIKHIRMDTHPDNKITLHLLESRGFERCGIIVVEDETNREAYELIKKEN